LREKLATTLEALAMFASELDQAALALADRRYSLASALRDYASKIRPLLTDFVLADAAGDSVWEAELIYEALQLLGATVIPRDRIRLVSSK
jgi:hypothetical protein